jgi:glycosyltransferase involved in cell wall biosynthesis
MLTVIPLGVDTRLFRPASAAQRRRIRARLGVPADAVCLGSFQKDGVGWGEGEEPKLIKGPDVLVEAAARLRKRIPNLFVLLTGPARGYVKRKLCSAGVPHVHHLATRYESLPQYYQALDLYVIGSRCEGGPLALPEAWATECPIVSTRVGVSADAIVNGRNGFLVDIDDVDALVTCSERLVQDSLLRESIRRQALRDVRRFDWDTLAAHYYRELYAPLLVPRLPVPTRNLQKEMS